MKKDIFDWLNDYNRYHKNKTNKIIHWICIPLIIFSLFGLLSLTSNYHISFENYNITLLHALIISSVLFYLRLSISITIGMLLFSLGINLLVEKFIFLSPNTQLYFYLFIFIIAWIMQFIGHKIEGKKPAFFKDLKFLLIGPAWMLSAIYLKLKIKI
tara:strand:- start:15 stop:485 length:471 start_codon:yes stop_codon:yes gene_type:complete